MQENTQSRQVIKGALLAILVGMIILAFWAALRPFAGATTAKTNQSSSSAPVIPQNVRERATAKCADTEAMRATFSQVQIDRFCQCANDKLAPYGGMISTEQTTTITYECLAVMGEA